MMSWRFYRGSGDWAGPVSRLTFRGPLPEEPGPGAALTVSDTCLLSLGGSGKRVTVRVSDILYHLPLD